MKVCVVTVNFNSEKETHDCLNSLNCLQTKGVEVQIIVIDNGSLIPFSISQEEEKQNITLLRNKKNLGFSGGYNTGLKKAMETDAQYVMILNNDTLVEKNCLINLLKAMEENPTSGIIVPKIYFAKNHEFHNNRYKDSEKGKVFWYAGGYMDWNNVFSKHRGVDEVDHGQYDVVTKVTFATGCCMFIPTVVLEKVGLFDDKLYLYYEDADLSQRVLHAGFSILYNPSSVIWHVNAASGGGPGSILHDYYLTRNRMIFGMRYAPVKTKLALLRESMRLLFTGRLWQKKGIWDFYARHYGKGSFVI